MMTLAERIEAEVAAWDAGRDMSPDDLRAIAAEVRELEREVAEALALTESCSTLREMAAACVEGAALAARQQQIEAREQARLSGKAPTAGYASHVFCGSAAYGGRRLHGDEFRPRVAHEVHEPMAGGTIGGAVCLDPEAERLP
jgi:hypothetical protein